MKQHVELVLLRALFDLFNKQAPPPHKVLAATVRRRSQLSMRASPLCQIVERVPQPPESVSTNVSNRTNSQTWHRLAVWTV